VELSSRNAVERKNFNRRASAAWGLCLVLISGALYLLQTLSPNHIGTGYICLYALMTAASLLIWYREDIPPKQVLLLGIFLLVMLFPLQALTSNDTERYLWDGAVFLSGLDPYLTAPNDSAAQALRGIWATPPEHAAYPTLYPPGALMLFGFSALTGPVYGFWVWKALATSAAILSLIIIYDLLRLRGALKHLPLIALSPLLLFETGAAAHLDVFCVLGITAALWSIEKDKILAAGIIIGIAASIKFLPAVIAGPFLFYLTRRGALKLFLGASLTWGLVYLTMFGLGYKPLGLLPTFFEKWRGGAPFYPGLEHLKTTLSLSNAVFAALLGALAVIGFGISARLAAKRHIHAAIILALLVPLLLSPVLFTWYLMALLPLLALRPNVTLIAMLTLAPLSYVVLDKWLSQGIWEPAAWPGAVLAAGIILGLAIDLRNFRRRINFER